MRDCREVDSGYYTLAVRRLLVCIWEQAALVYRRPTTGLANGMV